MEECKALYVIAACPAYDMPELTLYFPLQSDEDAASATSPLQEAAELETAAAPSKRRPLYHQPAWISPELHAWLVASGLFAVKPRRELRRPDL